MDHLLNLKETSGENDLRFSHAHTPQPSKKKMDQSVLELQIDNLIKKDNNKPKTKVFGV